MDARVDDFLNEINEIVPTKQKEQPISSTTTNSCDWEECFDETSGFSYYWNVNSNEVTWEIPSEYRKWKSQQKKPKPPRTTEKQQIYKPETQIFPMIPVNIPDTKIYKIGEEITKPNTIQKIDTVKPKIDALRNVIGANKKANDKSSAKRRRKSASDESEDDEKITLISSYGGDTESEEDETEEKGEISPKSKVTITSKELRNNKNTSSSSSKTLSTDARQPKVTGIALLSSYGESDDEESDIKQITPPTAKVAQSTLFPIQQLIDASQFDSSSSNKPAMMLTTTTKKTTLIASLTSEQKPYQRKRKIGLELPAQMTSSSKKLTEASENLEGLRTGFGFNSSSTATEKYSNFKSAGKITFVKSDSDSNSTITPGSSNDAELLKEKLDFLCQGKSEDVSPVQIMLIQLETLQTARLAGCLQLTYLQKWLQETNKEISILEKDSTPKGWLLEWDRGEKRYSYRHLQSGNVQWDYPTGQLSTNQQQVSEDMDICTTPPPITPTTTMENHRQDATIESNASTTTAAINEELNEETVAVEIVAPPPPKIGRVHRPGTPPPPILTADDIVRPPLPLMPEELPPPPPPPPEEPLPPGVDVPPAPIIMQNVQLEKMNTALDSFYSDLAAIESLIIVNNIAEDAQKVERPAIITNAVDNSVEKVKKTKKLKMSQGLSMKKKGVSKLVEKWKNVQKHLD